MGLILTLGPSMKPNRNFFCIVIFLIPALTCCVGFDSYNDIVEADVNFLGQKFENVDVGSFIAERNCFYVALIFTSILYLPEASLFFTFDAFPSSVLPLAAPVETLRC